MSGPRIPRQAYPWPTRRADACEVEAPARPAPPAPANLGALDPRLADSLQGLHRLQQARRIGELQGECSGYRAGYVRGWRWGVFCGGLAGMVIGSAVVAAGMWLGAAAHLVL